VRLDAAEKLANAVFRATLRVGNYRLSASKLGNADAVTPGSCSGCCPGGLSREAWKGRSLQCCRLLTLAYPIGMELIFEIRDAEEGGYCARALGRAISRKRRLGRNFAAMFLRRCRCTSKRAPYVPVWCNCTMSGTSKFQSKRHEIAARRTVGPFSLTSPGPALSAFARGG